MKQKQLQTLLKSPATWLSEGGEESELVLSTRVRLARNIEGRTFTHCAEASELESVRAEARDALEQAASMKDSVYLDMNETTDRERLILSERRLISQDMVKRFNNRGLVVLRGEKLSVMLNEEDHLRLQSFEAGLALNEAFDRVSRLDDELDGSLEFAFSDQFGYLTACATNVGTGLRVSAMVHLPGLVQNGDIRKVSDGLRHVRLNVRGSYGEGSGVAGNFFQISNSITLGLSESDTIMNMDAHIRKVLEFEKNARKSLLKEARSLLEDKIWRAYGTLRNARVLDSREAMGLISAVRLGVGLGLITDTGLSDLNEMLIMIQPMHLQMLYEKVMGPDERDRSRADYIRSRLKAS
ncbi:MAG: protein arginine kinase [Candidatus Krumholzibacteria bacterium]|nr:protein arginine kinase [Candidatus Krumholzibacteria bacterium]